MRIVVVKLSSVGDVVDVRSSAILKGSPVVDELIEVDSRRWRRGWFDKTTLREARIKLKQLRGTGNHRQNPADHQVTLGDDFPIRSEIAIDFQGLMKSAIIALLSGAERKLGFASYDLR